MLRSSGVLNAMRTHDLHLRLVRPNAPAPPTGNSETRYRVLYGERELGVWRDPEHSAARFLIDNGLADRSDMVRTFRDEKLCMTGNVGWFADRRTLETDRDGPRTVSWTPYPGWPRAAAGILAGRPSGPGLVSPMASAPAPPIFQTSEKKESDLMRPTPAYHPDDPPEASRSQDRRKSSPLSPYPAAGPSAAELEEARAILNDTEIVQRPRGRPNSNSTPLAPMSRR